MVGVCGHNSYKQHIRMGDCGRMQIGPRIKMVFGALLALFGVWWYIPGGDVNALLQSYSSLTNYQSLVAMFQGTIGVIAVLIGIFVVWLEHDEIKMRREMESEDFGRRVQKSVQAVAEGGTGEEVQNASSADDENEVQDHSSEEFTCEECGRSFDTKRGLSVHVSQSH